MATVPLRYRVSMPRPATHRFHVQLQVSGLQGPQLRLFLPAWTPGSYKIRDYAKNVQRLRVLSAAGEELACEKTDKQTWEIALEGSPAAQVDYQVFAFEESVRTPWLDDRHGFIAGAGVFLGVEGQEDRPCEVELEVPAPWLVATGLPVVPGREQVYAARDYHHLIDGPFELGEFRRESFVVRGVPHELCIVGENNLPGGLVADATAIVGAATDLFDDLPYPRYCFILHARAGGRGGLEHENSAVLLWPRFQFRPLKEYRKFLSLVAHEFFHAYNVKRIRPPALASFDYRGEQYCRQLWVAEGITSYYDEYLLRRAGLVDTDTYLEAVSDQLTRLRLVPGRYQDSLQEAGFDAWIKLYQPHADTVNQTVSYYLKGALVSLALDLQLRQASGGARSLDDVLRALYAQWKRTGAAFAAGALEAEVAQMGGPPLVEFLRHHTAEPGDVDLEGALAHAGLEVAPEFDEPPESFDPQDPARGRTFLGLETERRGDAAVIVRILDGSPAQQAGLSADDELIALDGYRVGHSTLQLRLSDRYAGDTVEVTVFRNGELRTFPVLLGEKLWDRLRIRRRKEGVTDAQRALYQAWLGAPWP